MIARRAVLYAVAALAGSAALPSAVRAQTLDTVNCGKLVGGFFREAGINVNWTMFPQSQAMVAPLAAGQLDSMGASVSAGIYNALGNGIPIRIVGDRGVDVPGYGALPLVVRADLVKSGRFRTLKDLKGQVAGLRNGSMDGGALRYYKDALHNGKLAGPNAASVVAILQDFIKLPDPGLWREITPSSVSSDGHVVGPSLETEYEVYEERGLITDPITVPSAVDLSYAEAANRQLGRYAPAAA